MPENKHEKRDVIRTITFDDDAALILDSRKED